MSELDVFGEGCLLESGGERVRNATVTATADVQALSLHRDEMTRLMKEGVLDSLTLYSMRGVREQRASTTAAAVVEATAAARDDGGIAL